MGNNTAEIILKVNADQFRKNLNSAGSAYQTELKGIRSESAKTTQTTQKLTAQVIRLGAAYVTLQGSIRLVNKLLTTGGNFESLRVQLEGVTGSAEAGEQAFAWIDDFVQKTPFGLTQVSDAFVKLKAFGLDPMDGTMQAIADQSALLGGSQETLNGIILAVGQAWAKQKLQGEEILQLVERGVPVWDLLAKATGNNAVELQKLSETGKLGRAEIKLLVDEMARFADGSAQAQVDTWRGLVSNATTEWEKFLDTLAQSGSLDYFKDQLTELLERTNELAETGELQKFAKDVSEAIIGIAKVLGTLAEFVIENRKELVLLAEVLVVKSLVNYAAGLASVSAQAGLLAGNLKGLKGLLGAGVLVFTATQLSEILSLYNEGLDIEENAKKYIRDQRKIIEENEKFIDTQALSEEAIKKLTRTELESYRQRFRAAVAGNRAILNEQSRTNPQDINDGPNETELAAAKNARVQRQSLVGVETALQKINDAHEDSRKALADIKQKETDDLASKLEKQKKLLEKHEKEVTKSADRTKAVMAKFADTQTALNQSGQEGGLPDQIDLSLAADQGKTALDTGDYELAEEKAEQARNMVQQLLDSGVEADLAMQGILDSATATAAAAREGIEQKSQSEMQGVIDSIETVEARLKKLQGVKLEVDKAASNEALLAAIAEMQETASNTAIKLNLEFIKAKLPQQDSKASAPGFASGGQVRGPGTSTSDSILAWLSNREFVQPAHAVDYYGANFMEALRKRIIPRSMLPGFAEGGAVNMPRPPVPDIRLPALNTPTGNQTTPQSNANFYLDNQRFALQGAPDVIEALGRAMENQALKQGGRA